MRSTPLLLGSSLALAGVIAGCAEEALPPVVPTAPVAPAVVAAPAAPPVDLGPVAEPDGLFAMVRWKSPNTTLTSLGTCAGLPQTLIDTRVKDLLDRALGHAFRNGVDGHQIADAIAVDASLDLVAAMDAGRRGQPDALFAFSVGLTSLDRARSALEAAGPLVELQPGLWRVGPKGSSDLTCAVGPAAGPAPARLICGARDRDVSALGPYLARNVSVAPPPARDLHAELRFTPFEARYGTDLRRLLGLLPNFARMRALGEPRFDRALDESAVALAEEGKALISDLDQITLDVGVDGATCVTASGALQLRGASSWVAGMIAERAGKQGPPPAIFWRAPADSESASYNHAADPARNEPLLKNLRALLEGFLAHQQIGSDADRKALAALLAIPLGKDTSVVVASGHATMGGPGRSPQPPPGGKLTDDQIAQELAEGYLGWYQLGFDEGPAALSKLLKDIVGVYGRKALLEPARKALGRDAASLPTLKLVAAPAQLGRGALDVEIHIDLPRKHGADVDARKDAKKKGGLTLHVLLMGEARSTWIAIGANRDELVKRLLASRSGAPESGTLAARQGLEPLRAGKALSSGFVSVGMFTRGVGSILGSPLLPGGQSGKAPLSEIATTLANLPRKGETPIFLSSTAQGASNASGPRTEFVVNMSKGSLEDVGAILLTLNRIAENQGLLRP